MKYGKEIKVALLAIVSMFLFYFGFNYLKGINIFHNVTTYYGMYQDVNKLVEQSPVYIKGYKVGQVEKIEYNFRRDTAFTVSLSISGDIHLPEGTEMVLVADGMLGGMAIELSLPEVWNDKTIAEGAFLPTSVAPGMMDVLQNELLAKVGKAIENVDSLVSDVRRQLDGDHIQGVLAGLDHVAGEVAIVSDDLASISGDMKKVVKEDVPGIVEKADSILTDVNSFAARLKDIEIEKTMAKVDSMAGQANHFMASLDTTIVAVDSLVVDLKANPKRYVHFSLFGKSEKKKK